MKGDKECEDHHCEALAAPVQYCHWHPDQCQGKPWQKRGRGHHFNQRAKWAWASEKPPKEEVSR